MAYVKSVAHDVNTREGLAAVAAVRDRFRREPDTDLSQVRPRIAESWRRSAAMCVDPQAPAEIDLSARIDEQTLRCAAPHVRELEHTAFEAGGDVTVISPAGTLRHDLTPTIADRYPEGRVLLESACGTNGDGTALEDGGGGWVYSQEHYRDDFSATCCYSTLIRDPFRGNVRACLTLTLPEDVVLESDPRSIALVVEGTAAKITRDLAARSATREQMLFAEYVRLSRRYRNGAILATDGKNTTVSGPALDLLREDDFAAILSYAHEAMRLRGPLRQPVTLSGDRIVELSITMAGDAADPLGAVVVVKEIGEGARHASASAADHRRAERKQSAAAAAFADLVGDSQAHRQALHVAAAALERRAAAHVIGERGAGKRSVAVRIAEAWADRVELVDCGHRGEQGPVPLDAVSAHLEAGSAVVLTSVDALSAHEAESLGELLCRFEGPRVVLTLSRPTAPAGSLIASLNSTEVSVPPLRIRREDIPQLATRFIADATDRRPSARLLYVLAQADWPGNVAQLKTVVEQAAIVARGAEVSVADLPQSFTAMTRGPLSRLEDVELQELRAALEEAGGNRTLAADILQIGRSTLYRRLDSYRRRGIVI